MVLQPPPADSPYPPLKSELAFRAMWLSIRSISRKCSKSLSQPFRIRIGMCVSQKTWCLELSFSLMSLDLSHLFVPTSSLMQELVNYGMLRVWLLTPGCSENDCWLWDVQRVIVNSGKFRGWLLTLGCSEGDCWLKEVQRMIVSSPSSLELAIVPLVPAWSYFSNVYVNKIMKNNCLS